MGFISSLLLTTAGCLGVGAHHLVFIHGEWHLKVPHIVSSHCSIFLAIYALCSLFAANRSFCFQLCTTYLLALYASIAIYRVFFHRIRHFPGPRLAAVTKLWHVWQSRNSENYLVMQRMHAEYGELVRTGQQAEPVAC
jgi:hypothetical protein